jgi:hypothetical protein
MSMSTAKIDTFINEIRTDSGFVAAVPSNPKWIDDLDDLDHALAAVYRNPEMIAIFDEILIVMNRRNSPMKQRLQEIGKLFLQALAAGRSVH